MITSNKNELEGEEQLDLTLRPQKLNEYVGQGKIKNNLNILMEAAKERKEPIEHVLLFGPPGLGKTTLAHIIAREMGAGIKTTSGPAIERVGDLGSILTNLNDGDILFIDEIHRMSKLVEEVLYPAMEDGNLDIIVGKGPSARTIKLDLPRFTLVGATTRLGMLSAPLRNRFGVTYKLEFYEAPEIGNILKRAAQILKMEIDNSGSQAIAECSRQTPRVANRLLKRVRDYAQIKGEKVISRPIATEALRLLEVDHLGLEPTDREILTVLVDKFSGGPVGLKTLAAAFSEEAQTIEEVYEPYLMQLGFIERTPRGRKATRKAFEHLGKEYIEENSTNANENKLF
ncbi:MAG TPA: Holliday junction branch migration DNA helicase RuvB [Candidatus Moranbacteria bacterium]|nr:Holliday junction branch migration DNA helicase RuvB [Candidatus Moranbacteria bacterium]